VRAQADPPNRASPLFIYPQLLYHIASYRPYLQAVCTADSSRMHHPVVTVVAAVSNCGVLGLVWGGAQCRAGHKHCIADRPLLLHAETTFDN